MINLRTHLARVAISLSLCICISHINQAQPATEFPPVKAATECTPRGGLPNFYSKIRDHKEINIAYLGGSITAQDGWRVKSLSYFRNTYPQCRFREINATIGGTGSNLGVFRLEHDVLTFNPDLLFVEFAVNDAGANPVEIARSMEGIVRKTWKRFPACDICFVYTFTVNQLEDLEKGKLNTSAAVMEVVADKYQIPSVHMGLEAVRLKKEGQLIMKAPEENVKRVSGDELNQDYKAALSSDGKIHFSKDGVHPYPGTGHQLYMEALLRSLPAIENASKKSHQHKLKSPLYKNNYENSTAIGLDKVKREGNWEKLPAGNEIAKRFANRFDTTWKAEPGASLTFSFKGESAVIYDLIGYDCGKLEINVDGNITNTLRFDKYTTYRRLSTTTVATNLAADKVHHVTIKVLPDAIDKRTILTQLNNETDFDKDPSKYDGANWYLGSVFIVGKIVE